MQMTLDNYILNPMLKQNAILNAATREIMRKQYENKFNLLLLRENGKIKYNLYYYEKDNSYWALMKIPSETVPNFYYDLVFKFTADASIGGTNDLFKFNVQFFSNDPAYTYTYAYVFRKNDVWIKELASKLSREALTKSPKEKNPDEQIGYEKVIYFGYLLMKQRGLNKLTRFKSESSPLVPKDFVQLIEPADSKIAKRQELGSKISKRKKINISKDLYAKVNKAAGGNLSDEAKNRFAVKTTKVITAKKPKSPSKPVKTTKAIKPVNIK